jgi:hypothetical protein
MVTVSKSTLCATIFVAVLASGSAKAQDLPVMDWSGYIYAAANASVTESIIAPMRRQLTAQGIDPLARPTPAQQNTSTAFTPSLTRRRANLANFVAKTRRSDPGGATKMEQFFASTDPIEAMSVAVAPYGLRVDNVADAYAIYWVQAWQAAHGDTSDPTRPLFQAIKQQSAAALGATPSFAASTDTSKQAFAEALMVQALLISAMVDSSKDDPAMMRQIGTAVRAGAKASGLDLDAMTLTPAGFVAANQPSR